MGVLLYGNGRKNGQAGRREVIAAVALATLAGVYAPAARAADVDVVGTQAAAIELPSIYGVLRRPGDNSGDELSQDGGSDYAFQAYLDTGTSGIILSQEDTEARNVQAQIDSHGNPVTFSDIAVNGSVDYNVSEPLELRLGRYTGESLTGDTFNNADTNTYFNQVTSNVRLQLTTTPVDDDFFETPLNLVGMPALKNKVMVVDARLYNHLGDIDLNTLAVHYNDGIEQLADFPKDAADVPLPQLQTWVYDKTDTAASHASTPLFNPGIPTGGVQHVVRFSYGDFAGYTQLSPSTAVPPTLAHNPFVGPVPFTTAQPGDPPPIQIHNITGGTTKNATGSWLFDTGAQVSFMSSAIALSLGVELSFDKDGNPVLTELSTGKAPDGEFSVALGGAGGDAGTLLGFNVTELDIPTTDGLIRLHDVPIGVLDVTLSDGTHTFTLDGDLGMNLLLPSMDVTAGTTTSSPFDFMTFDEAAGTLTLTESTATPEPTMAGLLVVTGGMLLRRRRSIA